MRALEGRHTVAKVVPPLRGSRLLLGMFPALPCWATIWRPWRDFTPGRFSP